MDNPSLIVRTLDAHLDHAVRLVLDIAFLIRHDRLTPARIEEALHQAVIPDLTELRDAFERAKPRVRELARRGGMET